MSTLSDTDDSDTYILINVRLKKILLNNIVEKYCWTIAPISICFRTSLFLLSKCQKSTSLERFRDLSENRRSKRLSLESRIGKMKALCNNYHRKNNRYYLIEKVLSSFTNSELLSHASMPCGMCLQSPDVCTICLSFPNTITNSCRGKFSSI